MSELISIFDGKPEDYRPLTNVEIAVLALCVDVVNTVPENAMQPDQLFKQLDEMTGGMFYGPLKQIVERLKVYAPQYLFYESSLMFLSGQSDRHGVTSLLTWSIFDLQRKAGTPLGIKEVAMKLPYGVPTEDFYHRCWDAQKRVRKSPGESDNLVDDKESYR